MKSLSCTKGENCPEEQLISELNYNDTRQDHMKKVSEYYNNVLERYGSKYDSYLKNSSSNDIDENEEADLEMNEKGEIKGLNEHLITITSKLNNLVMDDANNISIQQNKISEEKAQIVANDNLINELDNKLIQKEKNNKYGTDSLDNITKSNNNNNRNTNIYIVVNVILMLIIIVGLYYTRSL